VPDTTTLEAPAAGAAGARPALTRAEQRAQQAANLPDDVKARLDGLSMRKAKRLDVTSDEHQYVWGFRQNRPDEEHADRLADIAAGRAEWHEKCAAGGHDMAWDLEDPGVGYSPAWYGKCGNCGAGMSVGYGGTSAGRDGFRVARDVPCRGPGTAWQDDMQMDLARQRVSGAVAQFGQDVKDQHDRAWLADQGFEE
jgi:hypothetical protein